MSRFLFFVWAINDNFSGADAVMIIGGAMAFGLLFVLDCNAGIWNFMINDGVWVTIESCENWIMT
jgi:hypothetical protein